MNLVNPAWVDDDRCLVTASWFSPRSGLGLLLALLAGAAVLAIPALRRGRLPRVYAVSVSLLVFQVFHFVEHLAQLAYWFVNPAEKPWLTPWADSAATGLALWCSILPGQGIAALRGIEALHLVGNLLFLVGVIALGHATDRRLPGLAAGRAVQLFHVGEHVLLTASLFIAGSPIGFSTLFGLAQGTAWGGTMRVWFHFLINLAATAFVVRAWAALHRHKAAASYFPAAMSRSTVVSVNEPVMT